MIWRRADWLICLALAIVTLGLYSSVRHFEFVDFDDHDYATAPQIRNGITPDAVKWAFTSGDAANWIPLSRLSHMLDYQLYGPRSGPPHVTNAAIHALACLMLFAFLRRSTGARWKSAFVAFVFAWHPLHVESVAWVAERKDVLCAFFWFLTLWLWARYAERPGWRRYLPALAAFCLGLLAKPMIVTLPFVLLLIDAWPLRRPFSRKLLPEKVPFAVIAAIGSAITFLVQRGAGAVGRFERFPLGLRAENVLVTYPIYIAKTIWPARLAFWYPYPAAIPWWYAALCGVAIVAVSILAVRFFRPRPWLTVGWFWFLITLIPVIGLVQVGAQARADRYMYIPMAGLLIVAAWGAEALVFRRRGSRPWIAGLGAACCVVLLPVSRLQIRTWANDRLLFTHATEVTGGNYIAYNNLGETFAKINGKLDEAIACFETARRMKPDFAMAWYNLGASELTKQRLAEATADFQEALRLDPNDGRARNNLGVILSRQGQWAGAVPQLEEAVRLNPDLAEAQRNLGTALLKNGRLGEAVNSLETAIQLAPMDAGAQNMLGTALARIPGRRADAIEHIRQAIRIAPDLESAHANLGRLLAQTPGGKSDAITELRIALRIDPGDRGTEEVLHRLEMPGPR